MMKDGEAYEQLECEQYGSREGKNVVEQALNKLLSFDLIRQAQMDADMCSNDAKSCYDRIVNSIASILMQHQNVPASWAVPNSGVGQGNGTGPAIWAVVSTPVLKMMKDEGFRFMYKKRIEGKQLHFVGYSFVDDTAIIQSGQPGEPFQVLVTRMQASMDTWEGGLRAT
jgi:hypothetical protein